MTKLHFNNYHFEIRSSLEQMIGERDKLRNDLAESNERASLLAQEVDDRHARMEKASQMQIKYVTIYISHILLM